MSRASKAHDWHLTLIPALQLGTALGEGVRLALAMAPMVNHSLISHDKNQQESYIQAVAVAAVASTPVALVAVLVVNVAVAAVASTAAVAIG